MVAAASAICPSTDLPRADHRFQAILGITDLDPALGSVNIADAALSRLLWDQPQCSL